MTQMTRLTSRVPCHASRVTRHAGCSLAARRCAAPGWTTRIPPLAVVRSRACGARAMAGVALAARPSSRNVSMASRRMLCAMWPGLPARARTPSGPHAACPLSCLPPLPVAMSHPARPATVSPRKAARAVRQARTAGVARNPQRDAPSLSDDAVPSLRAARWKTQADRAAHISVLSPSSPPVPGWGAGAEHAADMQTHYDGAGAPTHPWPTKHAIFGTEQPLLQTPSTPRRKAQRAARAVLEPTDAGAGAGVGAVAGAAAACEPPLDSPDSLASSDTHMPPTPSKHSSPFAAAVKGKMSEGSHPHQVIVPGDASDWTQNGKYDSIAMAGVREVPAPRKDTGEDEDANVDEATSVVPPSSFSPPRSVGRLRTVDVPGDASDLVAAGKHDSVATVGVGSVDGTWTTRNRALNGTQLPPAKNGTANWAAHTPSGLHRRPKSERYARTWAAPSHAADAEPKVPLLETPAAVETVMCVAHPAYSSRSTHSRRSKRSKRSRRTVDTCMTSAARLTGTGTGHTYEALMHPPGAGLAPAKADSVVGLDYHPAAEPAPTGVPFQVTAPPLSLPEGRYLPPVPMAPPYSGEWARVVRARKPHPALAGKYGGRKWSTRIAGRPPRGVGINSGPSTSDDEHANAGELEYRSALRDYHASERLLRSTSAQTDLADVAQRMLSLTLGRH